MRTHVHIVPTALTYLHTVPTEPTSVHTVATAHIHVGLYNNYDLDIIIHKSLRLYLSWDLSIVYHYHDFDNEKIFTNIFFCNVCLMQVPTALVWT